MQTEDSDKNDIIKTIEKKSVSEISSGISETKKWQKNCPKCGKVQEYTTKKSYLKAVNCNKLCRVCNHKGMIGKVLTEEHKMKISLHHKLNGVGKWMVGRQLTKEIKEKISNQLSGRTLPDWQIDYLRKINTGKKHSIETKLKISRKGIGRLCLEKTRNKLRIKAIQTMESRNKIGGWNPFYSDTACKYFDELNRQNGWNLQHAMNGGEVKVGRFWVDAYDKERNIVVEYDEPHHFDVNGKLRKEDVDRMVYIKNRLGCKFYRYNQLTENFSSQ